MINFSTVKKVVIPEGEVKQIVKDGVVLWKSGYKNWVRYSTESDGKTIYNNGLGYKDGYRVRSGGQEGESAMNGCTGFIPCKAGDVIRFASAEKKGIWTDSSTMTALNFYNSSKTNLGQFTQQPAYYGIFTDTNNESTKVTKSDYIWTYTVRNNSDIAFVRVTVPAQPGAAGSNNTAASLIVTINEEIT